MVIASTPLVVPLSVADRRIGPGQDIFIIAEIGINHNQDLNLAMSLIDAAGQAGCDAAKFQTFRAKDLYVDRAFAGTYKLMGKDIPIYDLHTGLEMPPDWIPKLQERCKRYNMIFFSTPVAQESTDLLEHAGVPAFKISSYDMTNLPLVDYIARKGRPVIFSCGAATLGEIEETACVLQRHQTPYAIMQCIAKYPAPFRCANLGVMRTLRNAMDVPVGFSDNGFVDDTGRIDDFRVPVAAAQAGADLFEIHITLDRSLPGADHGFATTPNELKEAVARMREARRAYNAGRRELIPAELWGSTVKRTLPEEEYVRQFAYKCLFASKAIEKGDKLSRHNVVILRPGQHERGLAPRYFDLVTDKGRAAKNLLAWQPITWESILAS